MYLDYDKPTYVPLLAILLVLVIAGVMAYQGITCSETQMIDKELHKSTKHI
ncbi:hypothetical protein LCGC14_2418850, partial [marine sediment metagenome]